MDEQTARSNLIPKTNHNSPEATEAGAEPLQALESSVRDDRWMSRPRALIPKNNQLPPNPIESPQSEHLSKHRAAPPD